MAESHAVVGAASTTDDPGSPSSEQWDRLIDAALAGHGITSVFQPIVDVRRRVVAGYEALTRFSGVPGAGPDEWFAQAAARGVVEALDAAALRQALARRDDLPGNCFLTVNVEPESVFDPVVTAVLEAQGRLDGLAIEITEHRPIEDPARFDAALDRHRAAGAIIAVDDAGAGHAGLQQILLLRPGILKLDRALVEDVDTDEAKSAMVEMLGLFANRVDAWLLAEGVETIGEARRLEQLGVPLAQGYLFARPGAPWAGIVPSVLDDLRAFDVADGPPGLHALVSHCPVVRFEQVAVATRSFGASGERHHVVVDDGGRPVGLLTPESALAGTLEDGWRVNVHTSPDELASRLATRPAEECALPCLVTDNAGRLLGVVTIGRLLSHLADRGPGAAAG